MKETDYLKVETVNNELAKIFYIDLVEEDNQDDELPSLSVKAFSKEVKINKTYGHYINILEEFINKIKEISDVKTYPEALVEFKTSDYTFKDSDIRRLISKLNSCANYIATNGRIGPAQFAIMPHRYESKIRHLMNGNNLGGIKIIPTHLIKDIIILGRKNNIQKPGVFGFYNKETNMYAIESVGQAENQYHIFKVYSIQKERRKKLEEIEKRSKY